MKNSADQGGCYPQRPKAEVDNTLRDLQNSSYPTKASFNNCFIIHSKYFPLSDWLKPHAQFTITSCCSPNLERVFAILNQWWRQKCSPPKIIEPMTSKWRQKCNPLQIIEPLTEKTWGQGCVIFGERQNKYRNGETRLRRRKYFEWIIKQSLNSAFVGYAEFCRSRRVLSTSALGLCG